MRGLCWQPCAYRHRRWPPLAGGIGATKLAAALIRAEVTTFPRFHGIPVTQLYDGAVLARCAMPVRGTRISGGAFSRWAAPCFSARGMAYSARPVSQRRHCDAWPMSPFRSGTRGSGGLGCIHRSGAMRLVPWCLAETYAHRNHSEVVRWRTGFRRGTADLIETLDRRR